MLRECKNVSVMIQTLIHHIVLILAKIDAKRVRYVIRMVNAFVGALDKKRHVDQFVQKNVENLQNAIKLIHL